MMKKRDVRRLDCDGKTCVILTFVDFIKKILKKTLEICKKNELTCVPIYLHTYIPVYLSDLNFKQFTLYIAVFAEFRVIYALYSSFC